MVIETVDRPRATGDRQSLVLPTISSNVSPCSRALQVAYFVKANTANVHLFVEGMTAEGGSVGVIVPRQIPVVDLFDSERSGNHICGDSNALTVYWHTLTDIRKKIGYIYNQIKKISNEYNTVN
jgi:hypothetical protein